MALVVVGISCGSGSNSDTEDALRAELAETKAQLDQAQQVIATLQSGAMKNRFKMKGQTQKEKIRTQKKTRKH